MCVRGTATFTSHAMTEPPVIHELPPHSLVFHTSRRFRVT